MRNSKGLFPRVIRRPKRRRPPLAALRGRIPSVLRQASRRNAADPSSAQRGLASFLMAELARGPLSAAGPEEAAAKRDIGAPDFEAAKEALGSAATRRGNSSRAA
jgi:hypothetical protein